MAMTIHSVIKDGSPNASRCSPNASRGSPKILNLRGTKTCIRGVFVVPLRIE